MHSYLSSIGFSKMTKEKWDAVIYEAIRHPNSHEVAFDSDGNEMVEIRMAVCDRVGIAGRGLYDSDDDFKVDYAFPYYLGDGVTTYADLEIIRQSDQESYHGFCDEMRLGVNLIFYLQNMMEYLQKYRGRREFYDESYQGIVMAGLSLNGTILLPIDASKKAQMEQKSTERAMLIAAAREGDEDAIETLTLEDMDTYSMISNRVNKEDVYSIVTTSFMPYGIESDKYSVLGDIISYRYLMNRITMERLCLLKICADDVFFDVCINERDLLGEPAVGRRFKGDIWMQGTVRF